MRMLQICILVLLVTFTTGCSHYSDITGRVVDSTTGKPIEGAIVVAQWTKTRGIPGLQYHNLHKIVETLTDKEGKFSVSGTFGFLVDPPIMLIYKDGYIPWRNDSIFSNKDTHRVVWENNITYQLNHFSSEYTAIQLRDYLSSIIIGLGDVPKYHEIYNTISRKARDENEAKNANLLNKEIK